MLLPRKRNASLAVWNRRGAARRARRFLFVCIPRVAVRDIIGTTRVYNECHYSRTMGQAARRMFNWKIACLPVFLIRDSSLNPTREASHCDVFESPPLSLWRLIMNFFLAKNMTNVFRSLSFLCYSRRSSF